MKKLLAFMGAVGLIASSTTNVVACGHHTSKDSSDYSDDFDVTEAVAALNALANNVMVEHFMEIKNGLTLKFEEAEKKWF